MTHQADSTISAALFEPNGTFRWFCCQQRKWCSAETGEQANEDCDSAGVAANLNLREPESARSEA